MLSDMMLLWPRTHGNAFLRFCIVYWSQGNREQPAHYLKQYKNAGKRFRVYGALIYIIIADIDNCSLIMNIPRSLIIDFLIY